MLELLDEFVLGGAHTYISGKHVCVVWPRRCNVSDLQILKKLICPNLTCHNQGARILKCHILKAKTQKMIKKK